jgi:hypothetical protein
MSFVEFMEIASPEAARLFPLLVLQIPGGGCGRNPSANCPAQPRACAVRAARLGRRLQRDEGADGDARPATHEDADWRRPGRLSRPRDSAFSDISKISYEVPLQ